MAKTVLIPREGLVVRDPATMKPLPESGAAVNASTPYWVRRLRVGDVVKATRAKPAEKAKAKEAE